MKNINIEIGPNLREVLEKMLDNESRYGVSMISVDVTKKCFESITEIIKIVEKIKGKEERGGDNVR